MCIPACNRAGGGVYPSMQLARGCDQKDVARGVCDRGGGECDQWDVAEVCNQGVCDQGGVTGGVHYSQQADGMQPTGMLSFLKV